VETLRALTYKGFLQNYVRQLSAQNTMNIYKLVRETENNSRLFIPLYLYAKEWNKLEEYNAAVRKFSNFSHRVTDAEAEKVKKTYEFYSKKTENDEHTKSLMRNKILKLKKEKNISNYRIYTDLKLNGGNLNAFLKNGDFSKCGLKVLRTVLDYLGDY
jgi:hypothetical protein